MIYEIVNLADISIKITKGTTPTSIGCCFTDSGINYIKSESISNARNLDRTKYSHIDQITHEKLKRSQIVENDILFSMAGIYLGKTGIVKSEDVPANTNQAVAIIRVDHNIIDYRYVYYYLNQESIVKMINSSSSQSAQPNINLKDIGNIKISLPCIAIQKKIADILSHFDDKIELNSKLNDNLEKLIATIFAKYMEEAYEDDKVELSSFVQLISKGIMPIGIEKYEHYSIPAFDAGQYPVFDLGNEIKSNKYIVKDGDILLSKLNPTTKRLWYPLIMTDNSICSTEFMIYQAEDEWRGFVYAVLDSNSFMDYLASIVTGSTNSRQRCKPKDTLNYQIPFNKEKALQISKIVQIQIDMIAKNRKQNAELVKMKDALLPRLISGEIDLDNFNLDII
jgi:Restriction endonuclease S subunits